jgi:hypothetical protein
LSGRHVNWKDGSDGDTKGAKSTVLGSVVVWLGLELFLALVTDKVLGGALVRSSFFKVSVGRLAVKERHWVKAIQGYSSGTGRVDLRH